MALTTPTTLAAACTVNDTVVSVTSATGIAAGQFLRIDKEFMIVDRSYVSGTRIPVYRRGDQGSQAVAHQILADVVSGLFSDLPDLPVAQYSQEPASGPKAVSVGANLTFSATSTPPLPTQDTKFFITKGSACAIVWAAPSAAAPDGMEVSFFATVAAAHTITYTAGFYANTTSSDVVTFANAGESVTLYKYNGTWGIKSIAGASVG